MLAHREHSHLAIIDIQSRLAPAMHDSDALIKNTGRLIRYAGRMGVPVTFTEQMPERIGATLPSLLADQKEFALQNSICLPKASFSGWQDPTIAQRFADLKNQGRKQIVLAGMEAHVCVLQTALELLANDFEVLVVADAVGSRTPENHTLALKRMSKAGAAIVSHEMIAFEWLGRADTLEFKDLLPLFK